MAYLDPKLYTVAWLAPLEIEARAALHMLDRKHQGRFPVGRGDDYIFQAGEICGHNIIIATLPAGQEYGTGSAAALASRVKSFFPNLWFGLLVGVAAGLPNLSRNPPLDIRLGDVLVGLATGESAGLIPYDLGKETGDGFQLTRSGQWLANTEPVVRSAIGNIKLMAPNDAEAFLLHYERIRDKKHANGTFIDPGQEKDTLYQANEGGAERLVERKRRPDSERTRVWYGPIGTGDKLMKNARIRDELRDRYNIIGLEMEAAGAMNRIPVGVIRGVCDYGDEHKSKEWQPYAAAMAAAYAKAVLAQIGSQKMMPTAITMDDRLKRRLDAGDLPYISDDGRKRRRGYGVPRADNPGSSPFDNCGPGAQNVKSGKSIQNNSAGSRPQFIAQPQNFVHSMLEPSQPSRDCLESLAFPEMDNRSEDIDTAEGTCEPVTGVSHIIDTTTKQSLIDQLYFAKIDERLTSLAAAQGTTCRWFLTKPHYISWHDAAHHPDHGGFLWIKGNPGTGKSTLMKLLFEQAKLNAKGDSSQITLSFFFLARGTIEEKSTTGLYRSLLHQLFEKASELRDSLEWMTADGARVIQRNGWHDEALKQTLTYAIQKLGNRSLTIFVDALDECDKHQAAGMVWFFEELCDRAREAQVRLQICFSSRHYPTIVIQRGIEVTLEDEIGHTEDIQSYIQSKLRLGKSKHKLKQTESLRSEILEKSSGIFLWVVLVLDILNSEYPDKSVSITAIRKRLKEIPPKLNDLFEMILTRDGENLERLQVCLKWILFATRPLKPEEFYFAIHLGCDKECSGRWDKEDVDLDMMKTFVRSSSKGLAAVTRNKASEVQFIHESVRDFLLGKYEGQWPRVSGNFAGHSHELLRDCCLAQLNASISQDVDIPDPLPQASKAAQLRETIGSKFPFLEYSVLNVFHHTNGAQQNGIEQGGFLASFPLQRWIFLNNTLERFDIRRYTKSVSILYILAENNLADLIRVHPQREFCFDVEDERYGTPIFAALATHSREAVGALLKAHAETKPLTSPLHDLCEQYCRDGNKPANFGRHFTFSRRKGILSHVAEKGDEAVFAFALASDKLFDAKSEDSRTPLSYAAERGYEAVVRLLLEKGADVEAKDRHGRTPLWWAAERGYEAVVRLLLEKGADVEAKNRDGRTPLWWAAERGYEAVIRLLLEKGADIEAKNRDDRTPLSWAAGNGHEAVIKLLLEKGADVEARDRYDRTPLWWAAGMGYEAVIKLLLEKGADIEAKDTSGRTPLSWAAENGHEAVIKLLLEKGADVEARDRYDRTPLWWAAGMGYEAVIKLLLEKGADIEAKDTSGRTPLSWAAENGHEAVIKLLLEKGADVEAKDRDGRTPLWWATGNGHEAVVKLIESVE